jgi:hypothetical protein
LFRSSSLMVEYPLPVLGQTQYLTNSKIYFSFF